jgi:hypothetical protein
VKKLAVLAILTLAVSASAQFGGRSSSGGGLTGGECVLAGSSGRNNGLEDTAAPRDIDRSGFVYGRLRFHLVEGWRGEVPWHHDYPHGDRMLPDALQRLTSVHTTSDSYQIVDIDSKELFKYPFVYLAEPGFLELLPDDVKNLREYLDRGGFVFMDDFRGNELDMSEMANLVAQLKKLYPDRDLVTLKPDHPVFQIFFETEPLLMVAPYRRFNSGKTEYLALLDEQDNIKIMVDFNNDLSEYWQTLDVGICSLEQSGTAVKLGINYVIYAMTH